MNAASFSRANTGSIRVTAPACYAIPRPRALSPKRSAISTANVICSIASSSCRITFTCWSSRRRVTISPTSCIPGNRSRRMPLINCSRGTGTFGWRKATITRSAPGKSCSRSGNISGRIPRRGRLSEGEYLLEQSHRLRDAEISLPAGSPRDGSGRMPELREAGAGATPPDATAATLQAPRLFRSAARAFVRRERKRNPRNAQSRRRHPHLPTRRYLRGGVRGLHAVLLFHLRQRKRDPSRTRNARS